MKTLICLFIFFALSAPIQSIGHPLKALPPSLKRPVVDKPSNVNALADLYSARYFAEFPEAGTFFGIPKADNAGLSDNSMAGVKRRRYFEDSLARALTSLGKNKLNKQDAITYGILLESSEGAIDCRICRSELWSVNQMSGWQVWFSNLSNIQPVGNDRNRAQTIERWKKMPRYIQNEIDNLKEGLKLNYTIPKQNVRLVIVQLEEILKQPVRKSFFYNPARRDTTHSFAKELEQVIEQQIYPQAAAYKTFLTSQYLNNARESLSITKIPNGAACYKALLRASTSLKITPLEVYNAGIRAGKEREAKIIEIGSKLFATDKIEEINQKLRSDTSNRFASKEELLAFSNDAVVRAKNKINNFFTLTPTASVKIEPMPDYQKAGFSHYTPAPDDNSRPAVYYIQLYEAQKQDKGEVEKTAFHEAYPGHHLQLAIARELIKSHPVTKYIIYSGFAEGWARYCESLSDEMGLYSSERNRLSAYAGLPTGMVVDPGIHSKGWTRDQAIAYTLEKQPIMTRQMAESYVDRIAIWPGQMTTYGVGEVLFWQLRKRAEAALGKKFDLKTFHTKCLELGTIPLNMLEQHVTEWLKQTLANPTSQK